MVMALFWISGFYYCFLTVAKTVVKKESDFFQCKRELNLVCLFIVGFFFVLSIDAVCTLSIIVN